MRMNVSRRISQRSGTALALALAHDVPALLRFATDAPCQGPRSGRAQRTNRSRRDDINYDRPISEVAVPTCSCACLDRLGKEVALEEVAADTGQGIALGHGLDALGVASIELRAHLLSAGVGAITGWDSERSLSKSSTPSALRRVTPPC